MRKRIYRYNQPEANTLVDILNYTNGSKYKLDQLTFDAPLAVDHVKTKVLVKSAQAADFTNAVELNYSRYDLGTTFSENPLVIDIGDITDAALFEGILEQQKVLFELSGITILRTPLEIALADNILDGIGFAAVTDPDSLPELPVVDNDGNYNFVVRAKPGSLIWVGETSLLVRPTAELLDRSIATNLAVRQYLTETKDSKTPIELIYDVETDATVHGEIIAEQFEIGNVINDVSPFLNIARALTRDNWVASNVKSNFNLQGSVVLYKGYNAGEYATGYPEFSHILVIRLGDLCRNLKGIWTIQYNDPTVFHYDQCRVDTGTVIDPL